MIILVTHYAQTAFTLVLVLIRKAAEAVLRNTDPYRLAILYFRRKEYEAATEIVRHIIKNRHHERTWAFHAWGTILRQTSRVSES